jgi:hypothetical protein
MRGSDLMYILRDPDVPKSEVARVYNSPKKSCVVFQVQECLAGNVNPASCIVGVAVGAYGLLSESNREGDDALFKVGVGQGSGCRNLG